MCPFNTYLFQQIKYILSRRDTVRTTSQMNYTLHTAFADLYTEPEFTIFATLRKLARLKTCQKLSYLFGASHSVIKMSFTYHSMVLQKI